MLGQSRFINLVQRDYTVGGKSHSWVYATRRPYADTSRDGGALGDDTRAVVIVGKDSNNDCVLIKQVRYALADNDGAVNYEIAFPAGLIEPGETAVATARRELLEETGYAIVGEPLFVSPPLCNSAGLTDEKAVVVFCNVEKRGEPTPEPTEQIEVVLAKTPDDPRVPTGDNIHWCAKAYLILFMNGMLKGAYVDIGE